MSFITRNLTFYMNKLSGYSKQTVKLRPIGNDTAEEDAVVTFRLPSAIIDLHSLNFLANAKITYTTDAANPTDAANVADISFGDLNDYIKRLDVSANGTSLNSNLMEYNTAHRILDMLHSDKAKTRERHMYSSSYRLTPATGLTTRNPRVDNVEPVVDENHDITKIDKNASHTTPGRLYSTEGFLGFLSGSHQRFLPSNLFGDLEIRITLDNKRMVHSLNVDATPLTNITGITKVAFSDIHMVFETIHFETDMFNEMMEERLSSGEPIEIPFTNLASYTNSLSTANSTTVFSLATDSLDHLICTQRRTVLENVDGYKPMDDATAGLATWSPGCNGNCRWHFTANNCDYQWIINDTAIPSFRADPDHIYALNKQALNSGGDLHYAPAIDAPQQFREGRFAFVTSFNHHTDELDHLQSGLDTKGSNATMQLQTFDSGALSRNGGGMTAGYRMGKNMASQLYILALMTSTVRVFAGKVIELSV